MDLLPYQTIGRNWLASRRGASLLGDDPGLGKTAQAICAIVHLALAEHGCMAKGILIICPASLRTNWKREWQVWCPPEVQHTLAIPEPRIVSYEQHVILHKRDDFKHAVWSVAVVDEAHYCKTKKAQRTKAILGETKFIPATGETQHRGGVVADRLWFMTGTPISKSPSDFFTLLNRCAPHAFGHKHMYEQRYCDGHMGDFGWVADGATNLDELRQRIQESGIMLRRLKGEVLTQLPPKRRQVLELPLLRGNSRELKAANDAIRVASGGLLDANTLGTLERDEDFFTRVMQQMASARRASSYRVPSADGGEAHVPGAHEVREILAGYKVDAFEEWLQQQIEERGHALEPTIVWAYYHSTIDRLCQVLDVSSLPYVVFDGRSSTSKRDAAVKSFQSQTPGSPKIFIGSPAAYTGITLTAASRAVFVEYSYTPMDNVQAEDRCHRLGSVNPVLIQYLAVEGSYDTYILRAMVRRMESIKTLLG